MLTKEHSALSNRLGTPTDLSKEGVDEIGKSLRHLLADVFALFIKTKNFHWHMSGRISAISTGCWTTSRINCSP